MRRFYSGVLVGLLPLACASTVVYQHYGLNLPDSCYDQGTLLGKLGDSGWPDLPFAQCKPDAAVKGKCVVELEEVFFKKQQDLDECHQALKDCQQGPPPH